MIIKPRPLFTDIFGNLIRTDQKSVKLPAYKYISEEDKKNAENAGAISLYTMATSLAISVGISLILYFFIHLEIKQYTY